MTGRVYENTKAGVLEFLAAASLLNLTEATCECDPQVCGVWKVTTPKDRDSPFTIVYLAGYADPFGRIREFNDFECEC